MEDNIKMDLIEKMYKNVDWIYMTEVDDQRQTLVNMVVNIWAP
jgi:hypothetical protein